MKVAIYCRVSTDRQTTDNQNVQLSEVADKMGWEVTAVYSETMSGATKKRPELDRLMESALRKEVDLVMAWDISRLSRSLLHLVELLADLHSKDIGLYIHTQKLDTTTPSGRAMFQMMGVFAEFEKEMIRERVHAGLDRARKQGKTLGRPKIPPIRIAKVKELRDQNMSLRKISNKTGLSYGAVQRIVAD